MSVAPAAKRTCPRERCSYRDSSASSNGNALATIDTAMRIRASFGKKISSASIGGAVGKKDIWCALSSVKVGRSPRAATSLAPGTARVSLASAVDSCERSGWRLRRTFSRRRRSSAQVAALLRRLSPSVRSHACSARRPVSRSMSLLFVLRCPSVSQADTSPGAAQVRGIFLTLQYQWQTAETERLCRKRRCLESQPESLSKLKRS